MEYKQYESEIKKLYSPWGVGLCVVGLGINVLFKNIVIALELPLYLDNIGGLLVGALGGGLPGMAVGFLTNYFASLADPISLYYGALTVVMAWLASVFSQAGSFRRWRGAVGITASCVVIGGGCGSVLTWLLYGGEIGGLGAPLAYRIAVAGIPDFFAQLTADLIIDVPDKAITVAVVCLVLRFCPASLLARLPLGYLYTGPVPTPKGAWRRRRTTINVRITNLVMAAVTVTSMFSIFVSISYHADSLMTNRRELARVITRQAAEYIDGDAVLRFLSKGEEAYGYRETEQKLKSLYDSVEDAEYLFVYAVREDGVHVVFDLDTPDMEGDAPGTVLVGEQGLSSYYKEFLQGGDIPDEYSNGEYGNILTVYTTVYDSRGQVAAYAGVDIDMEPYMIGIMKFAIQVISIVFAAALLIFAVALWLIDRRMTVPICMIVDQANRLQSISPEQWLDSPEWKNRAEVHTGDELEELYNNVYKMEENASLSMRRVIAMEQKLLQTKELASVNQKLAAAIQKADEANRSKSEFMSRMSHDMRTPMNGILGLARLSADEQNVDALHESMAKIEVAGEYLLGLVNDTLDIQKIESGNITLTSEVARVGDLVDSVCQMSAASARQKGLELRVEKGPGVDEEVYLRTDPMRIRQIFTNLLTNAVKFTPAGGSIVLRVERLEETETTIRDRFLVTDTGIGMSREFLKNGIFKPFSQERSEVVTNYGGSGLGLSIVKRLVELMGGSIAVSSELGEGTTFTVEMSFEKVPAAEAAALRAKKIDEAQNKQQSLQGKRILLAEDHPLNAEIATRLLQKAGCLVDWAKDGRECTEKFAASEPGHYAAVLMDIRMPVMDGLQAARVIRAMPRVDARTVAIVAMSANAFAEDVQKSRNAGMNAHLSKPVEPGALFATLASYIR